VERQMGDTVGLERFEKFCAEENRRAGSAYTKEACGCWFRRGSSNSLNVLGPLLPVPVLGTTPTLGRGKNSANHGESDIRAPHL